MNTKELKYCLLLFIPGILMPVTTSDAGIGVGLIGSYTVPEPTLQNVIGIGGIVDFGPIVHSDIVLLADIHFWKGINKSRILGITIRDTYSQWNANMAFHYYLPVRNERYFPYIGTGFGLAFSRSTNIWDGTQARSEEEIQFCMQLLTGIDVILSSRTAIVSGVTVCSGGYQFVRFFMGFRYSIVH